MKPKPLSIPRVLAGIETDIYGKSSVNRVQIKVKNSGINAYYSGSAPSDGVTKVIS